MMTDLEFRGTLKEIARLEEDHNFIGVSFQLREGAGSVNAYDTAEHVLEILQETVELSREAIPLVKRHEGD